MNWNNLLNNLFNLINLCSNVRNLLNNFLDFSIANNFLFSANYFDRLRLNSILNNYFLKDSWNLDYFFNSFSHWYQFFYNSIDWHRNFNWDNDLFLYFNYFWNLYLIVDNFFNWNISWYFLYDLYDSFNNNFMRNDFLLNSLQFDKFINHFFNNSINLDIDILFNNNFFDFSLENWDLNNLFNLFDSLLNHKFRNNSLDNLRNLNYFFYNTRYNYNFLDNFLNLHNFRYFNHFFDDLFYWNFNLFDSINMSENFNNLFFNIFDWFRYFDVVVDNLLDLNCFWLSHNNRISDFNNHWHLSLDDLNTRFLDYFLNFYNSFVDNWHFNNSLYLVRNLFVNFNDFSNYLFHFFDSVYWNYLFHNYLHRIRSVNCVSNTHNLLDNLRNFNYPLFSLDNYNWLFDNSINDNVSNFNVIFNLFSGNNIDFFHYLLNNFLNFHNLWNSNNLLDYFFNINWNFYNFFDYLFDRNYFFLVDNYFFNLGLNVINHFPNSYRFLNFNDLLDNSVNSMHFGHFSNHFDYSVLHSGYFNRLFNNLFDSNHLLLTRVNNNRNFYWHWDSLFNLNNLLDFNNFFNDFLNRHDLRNFYYSFNDFLHNFFNFNDFRNNSKDFQDVIDIDNIHNLLINHSNNSLIDFKSHSCSSTDFFKFF